jgi:hypothetical protein
MYDTTILISALVAVGLAFVAILPSLGFDIRIKGRQPSSHQPANQPRRDKRVWIALSIAIIAGCLSIYGLYEARHPKIVEKIVEKPVDRIVVQQCPQVPCRVVAHGVPAKSPLPKTLTNTPAPVPVTASDHSIAIGSVSGNGNTVSPSITTFANPGRSLSAEDQAQLKAHIPIAFHSKLRFWSIPSAPDSYIFAVQLKDAFKAAGVRVDDNIQLGAFTDGTVLYGVLMQVPGADQPKGTPVAFPGNSPPAMLAYVLAAAHVEIGGVNVTSKLPEDTMEIMVGFNPADKPK